MRTLFSTLTGIIIVILLATIVIGFIGWSRVPDIVASNLSKKLKVLVEIDDMSLKWGEIHIDQVSIGNPPHSILPKAFSCKSITIGSPFTNYFDQQVVIDLIEIDHVYLGLEFDSITGTSGNWTRIMNHFKESTDGPAMRRKRKTSSPLQQKTNRSILINHLVLTNIDVDLVYRKEGGKVQKLKWIDRIELTNVSSEGGLPMDQIMSSVLGQMLKSVFEKQNLQNMLQNLLPQPGSRAHDYLAPFKKFLNQQLETEKKSAESA